MGDRKVITAKGIKLTTKERSEWLLFNAKSNELFFQLYHGENKLHSKETMM
jgi:hypothetical protein